MKICIQSNIAESHCFFIISKHDKRNGNLALTLLWGALAVHFTFLHFHILQNVSAKIMLGYAEMMMGKGVNGQQAGSFIQNIIQILKNFSFKIEIKMNLIEVDFLGVTFDLAKEGDVLTRQEAK